MSIPVRAALAPFLLVAAYAFIIGASPAVGAATILTIAASHLSRALWFLSLLAGLALSTILVVSFLHRETRGRPMLIPARFLTQRWREDRLLSMLLAPLYLALLLAAFSSFKQFILPAAGFGLDPVFAAIDRALFLGVDPWRVTHGLLPSALGTWALDIAYLLWFLPMLLFVLLSWAAPLALRTQFLAAFAMTWILLGTLLAYLLPGSGPCYYEAFHDGADFAALTERLASQNDYLVTIGRGEILALTGQQELLDAFRSGDLMLAGGISAMPSLHNALAVLFACAGFACHRMAGCFLAAFAAVIWIASIHLGWHYAIDGLVGGTLAILVWRLAGAWTKQILGASPAIAPALPAAPRPAES